MYEYKVSGLNEEKYVLFYFSPLSIYDSYDYYIYYPEDDVSPYDPHYEPPHSPIIHYPNESIFEVFNVKDNETQKNVKLYKFDGAYNYVLGDLPHNSSVLKYFDLTRVDHKDGTYDIYVDKTSK